MIHVIATIETRDGQRGAFLDLFHKLVPEVKAEPGCIAYGPTVDVSTGLAAQSPVRPNVVTVVEQWESVDALKKHLDTPHMQRFGMQSKELVEKISLLVVEPA